MTCRGISEEVQKFIMNYIDSVEILEVLFLLKKQSDKDLTAIEVGEELRTNVNSASRRLSTLCSRGLLTSKDLNPVAYRYAPKNERLNELVGELEEVYKERRYTVIDLIFSHPIDQIQTFADAFNLRKNRSKDG